MTAANSLVIGPRHGEDRPMVTMAQIQALAADVARVFDPEQVVLFGSHARGDAGPHSDVDLLVVMEHEGRNREKALEILMTLDPPFGVDILVREPAEFRSRIESGDWFAHEILTEGRVLHERRHAPVG